LWLYLSRIGSALTSYGLKIMIREKSRPFYDFAGTRRNKRVWRYGFNLIFFSRLADILRVLAQTKYMTDEDIDAMVSINNEEHIYKSFRRKLQGRAYSKENAERFLAAAREGWQNNEWFTFLVKNAEHPIAAMIYIKFARLEGAEIGYLASARTSGLMTNTVREICEVAKEAGYMRLSAIVGPDNEKSIGVLLRANFVRDGDEARHNTVFWKFTRML
jgi:RimJ/RimL family protein N-acetyltransferase